MFFDATPHPVEAHVNALERFWRMLPASMLWEVALSVLIEVGGCGWVISFRVVRMGTACWPLSKIAPVSASAADAMTVRMVWHLVRICPFEVGVGRMGGWGVVLLR